MLCFGNVNFTRQQWLTAFTFIVVNFCNAMVVSMQAPFYPHEAEKKGCVPSEYGLVFGIFELTVFIVSPILGANLNRLGMKATLNVGIGTVGVTAILFGCLDKIDNGRVFLALSFALRMIEACGNAGFLTGSFSMIAKEFPDNVATMFAISETFFGIGMIVGPTVGGALYELGGFTLPFASLGSVLVLAAIFCAFVLPHPPRTPGNAGEKPSMFRALLIPDIAMDMYCVACSAASLGFIQATLEPHMRDFNMQPLAIGAMFVINGGFYGVSAPFWGFVCDRKPPKIVTFLGTLCMISAFALMGPLPFFPFGKSKLLIAISLVLQGLGLGCEVVSGFADAHKQAIRHGFPDTIDTYGLISGMWTSVFALGAFVGPTVAGILFDAVGFPYATCFIIATQLLLLAILILWLLVYFCSKALGKRDEGSEDERGLVESDTGDTSDDRGHTSERDDEDEGAGVGGDIGRRHVRRQHHRHRRGRHSGYSEVVPSSLSGSMAKSMGMAYPQFMLPGVANSYRNPPPSLVADGNFSSVNDMENAAVFDDDEGHRGHRRHHRRHSRPRVVDEHHGNNP